MLKILCVGPQWRGSNAGALFRAFSKLGHVIQIVDENYYLNLSSTRPLPKIIDKLTRRLHVEELNRQILFQAELLQPDLVVVFKGAFVVPSTIIQLRQWHIPAVNFYPDVSFTVHGRYLPQTLGLFDHVFTTKTFGLQDMKEQLGVTSSTFIPHGFDPEFHYPRRLSDAITRTFSCAVSFIGDFDHRKESVLDGLTGTIPDLDLKIWGSPWVNSRLDRLRPFIMGKSIHGDLYPVGIQSSQINLGLLSAKRPGASSGDRITSRSFHIPAIGGFMIHERTDEILQYYDEGKEIECFDGTAELSDKVRFYLKNEGPRQAIAAKGHLRTIAEHSVVHRAAAMLRRIDELQLLRSQ